MGVIGLVAKRTGNCVEAAAAAVAPGIGLEYDCKSVDSAGDACDGGRGDLGARAGFVGTLNRFNLCASNRAFTDDCIGARTLVRGLRCAETALAL
jgi:hypothetical protein